MPPVRKRGCEAAGRTWGGSLLGFATALPSDNLVLDKSVIML